MKKYILIMMLLAAAVHLPAQTNTLQRRYVPIVIKGVQLPLASFNSTEWRAFRYQASQNQWQLVPFQAEGVASDGKYNRAWSGIVDSNDELIFMTQDLGDKAQARWYDDPSGRSATRLELEFSEQLDPAKKGWIYLYKSSQIPIGYQSHIDGPTGTAADTVVTPYFKLGHNKDGWLDYISLSSYPGIDLLDRLKLRLAGNSAFIGGNYAVIEDTLNKGSYTYWPWLIRTHRDQRSRLSIPQLSDQEVNIDYGLTYFPYSMTLGVEGAQVNALFVAIAGGKTLRQSIDLAPKAGGMKFYSENNRGGVTIDGQTDAIDPTLAIQTGLHWAMASGQQGTLLLIMEMPGVKGGTTRLYYRDSQSGGTNDGTPESGDGKSYGDMGLWAQANSNSNLSMSQITMGFTLYMLPERSRDAVFADSLFTWVRQPLAASVVEQIAPATGVALNEQQPTNFRISPAYPNPVSAANGSVQFRVASLRPGRNGEARIYNSLGQTIRTWAFSGAGQGGQILIWNLRDSQERAVVPGTYYMQVRVDGMAETRVIKVIQ